MKRWSVFFLLCAVLCGCAHRPGREDLIQNWPVVTQITVTCEDSGQLTRRVYTSAYKMQEILNCIRSLGQRANPDIDPEQLNARTYCITLYHSDDSQQIYRMKADRYWQIGRNPWQQVDPEKAMELTFLFQGLPGDDPQIGTRKDIPRHFDPKY